ncbi:MAG TPA: MFS transporter [Candidatus Dormibacteraeota bacterium]|nr:MFS transporter [Candidatus Dormibacteraeota bacterium]
MHDLTAEGAVSPWKRRGFELLWSAQTISEFGTQVTAVALPLTAIVVLHAGVAEMVVLSLAIRGPFVLSLLAGATVDRTRRRPVMIVADVGRALLIALVPLTYALGVLRLEIVYLVALATAILTVWFDVAYQSYLPSLVERDRLMASNSKIETTRSAALILGPGLGGLLVQLLRAPVALVVDAVSYAASAAFVLSIRSEEPAPAASAPLRSIFAEIVSGVRYVAGHPVLRVLLLGAMLALLAQGIQLTVLVLYLSTVLHLAPVVIGLVLAAAGPGALVGATVAPIVTRRLGLGPALAATLALYTASLVVVPLARDGSLGWIVLLMASQAGMAISYMLFAITVASLRQAIVPAPLLGRATGTARFLAFGAQPIGALLAGSLAGTVGVRGLLFAAAVIALLAPLAVLVSRVRGVRTFADAQSMSPLDASA